MEKTFLCVLIILAMCPVLGFPAETAPAGQASEVALGQYSIPLILMVLLALLYKTFQKPDGTSSLSDPIKTWTAITLGAALGIVVLFYKGLQPTFPVIVDNLLYGIMTGAAAVGLWEGYSKLMKGH